MSERITDECCLPVTWMACRLALDIASCSFSSQKGRKQEEEEGKLASHDGKKEVEHMTRLSFD